MYIWKNNVKVIKMGKLGVSLNFNREKNLAIIKEKYLENPILTKAQVNFLSRFPCFGHIKGKEFPECKCLRCEGLKLIEDLEKNGIKPNETKPKPNLNSITIKPNLDNEWKV
jgi:hypothetical protein